jgi:GINS complex subunit 2
MELGEMLLEAASDDFEDPDNVRKLLRGLREVRMAKLRSGVEVLDAGGGVKMNGVGGMEVGEGRAFVTGVIDGLRFVMQAEPRYKTLTNAWQKNRSITRTAAQRPRSRRAGKRVFRNSCRL